MLLIATAALADGARTIAWQDLLPEQAAAVDDPFAELSQDQVIDLAVLQVLRRLKANGALGVKGTTKDKEITADLAAQGIDVEQLLAQRDNVVRTDTRQAEAGSAIVGQRVRIAGYALPLETTGDALTEFLLVPWVGACIHAPVPPANQILHVSLPKEKLPGDRFTPVVVEGRIEHRPHTYELFLVDGRRDVRVAYAMIARGVDDALIVSDSTASDVTSSAASSDSNWWRRLQRNYLRNQSGVPGYQTGAKK